MNKKIWPAVFLFLFSPFFLNAQIAEIIEDILETKYASFEQAAWIVVETVNSFNVNVSVSDANFDFEQAFLFAAEKRWIPARTDPKKDIKLRDVSRLIMRAFNMKGGPMYSVFKNSHYAYRELVYQRVIQGRADPGMKVSGDLLLFLVNRVLHEIEIRPWGLEEVIETLEEFTEEIVAVEAANRREALAAEIAAIIEEQAIADTTVEATEEGVTITFSNIVFLADSVVLPNAERIKIYEIAGVLKGIPNIKLLVAGHATHIGTEEYQLALSTGRAQSVADYLVSLEACEAENIIIAGYGSSRPIADNNTPEGMALNRRVEITILEDN
ncbi:MAG: OmpA family protein [Treponema sp.]|nr:OmpA family protein [Treponema sp.]